MGLLFATPALSQAIPTGSVGPYNVIVIVLDDLGTDQLALYGENPSACDRTPRLQELWNRGILFSNAIVNPMCSPTRSTFMTGRYGFRTGVGLALDPGTQYAVHGSELFLPELLPSDYVCGAFGKWHLTTMARYRCHAVDNGFDRAKICMLNESSHYRWSKVTNDVMDWAGATSTPSPAGVLAPCLTGLVGAVPVGGNVSGFTTSSWSPSVARTDTLAWISSLDLPANPNRRFFAYVGFNPPHAPEEVPPNGVLSPQSQADVAAAGWAAGPLPAGQQTLVNRRKVYDLSIEAIDYDIGELLDGLSPTVLNQTVVIVIGDNGTPEDMIVAPQLPLHGKRTLYRGGTRAPLLIAGPTSLIASMHHGSVCNALVNGVDVWRTVANLTRLSDSDIDTYVQQQYAPALHPIDGVSMLPLFQAPASATIRDFAFSESFASGPPPVPLAQHSRMVTDGLYTYIVKARNGVCVGELYHVANSLAPGDLLDQYEETNLLQDPGSQVALSRLKNAMQAILGPGTTCP